MAYADTEPPWIEDLSSVAVDGERLGRGTGSVDRNRFAIVALENAALPRDSRR